MPDPANAPGATPASDDVTESQARKKLAAQLADDTNIDVTSSAAAQIDWVTVKSPDNAVSMDVPSTWSYVSFSNSQGGTTFGAAPGDITRNAAEQRVLHGGRTNSLDTFITEVGTDASVRGCSAEPVRPYEDSQFVGKGRVYNCSGRSTVAYGLDGKGDKSNYHAYFFFVASDATGAAAVERAISTLAVVGS